MTWINASESLRWRTAPDFNLPSNYGFDLSLSSFWYRSNLVILFGDQNTGLQGSEAWASLVRLNEEIQNEDGKLVVIQEAPQAIRAGFPGLEGKLFPILFDRGGSVRQKYDAVLPDSGKEGVLLLVLDRYGAIFSAYRTKDLTMPLLGEAVVSWLNYIDLQCPE